MRIYGAQHAWSVFQRPAVFLNSIVTPNQQIYELLQGRVLFRGRPGPEDAWSPEEDHLAQMIELFGPLPSELLDEGSSSRSYFDQDGMLKLSPLSSSDDANLAAIAVCATLGNMLNIHHMYPCSFESLINHKRNPSLSDDEVPALQSFLQSMLQYRPEHRVSAGTAATDPWLQNTKQARLSVYDMVKRAIAFLTLAAFTKP